MSEKHIDGEREEGHRTQGTRGARGETEGRKEESEEAAEKAAEAGENPIKAKAPQAPVSFPCTV